MALVGEYYVTLIPCSQADHERIFHTRTGPHQRIKVSTNSRLSTIADYIVSLVPSLHQRPFHIALYVKSDEGRVRVPLCLSVAELFFMTNQSREGGVFYSFVDLPAAPWPEVAPRESSVDQTPFSPPVYHSGLSMFSNSFGSLFSSHDSGSASHRDDGESSVDLREHLESLLSGHTF
jgi:hypothetical protein